MENAERTVQNTKRSWSEVCLGVAIVGGMYKKYYSSAFYLMYLLLLFVF
jgi:hypothetical protein